MHFFTSLQNAWTYFNVTYHNYSLPDQHDNDDIFKVTGSKVKVTDNISQKCTFLVDTYWSMIDSWNRLVVMLRHSSRAQDTVCYLRHCENYRLDLSRLWDEVDMWKWRAGAADWCVQVSELKSELDLRLHIHEPRARRAELDVHNVRASKWMEIIRTLTPCHEMVRFMQICDQSIP